MVRPTFAMVARNFARGHNTQIRRQNLFRTAAVAILTRGLTTVKTLILLVKQQIGLLYI